MSYKKQSIKIEDLLINLENPRFAPVKDQQEALKVMLEKMKSKIKNLATDIVAEKSLNPTKSLCVFKSKQSKYVVLDGNRRLVAIKLIKKPNIIKFDNDLQKFFKQLNKNHQNVPEDLNCVVFESKADAEHWITLEHTGYNKGVGQVDWDAEQKARYQDQIKQFNRPYIQVIDLMEKNNIPLKQGQATNIERLVKTAYVKEKIGLDFQNKRLVLKKDKKTVLSNLKKVAKVINTSDFNVGEIYTAKQRKKLIDETLIDEEPPKIIVTKREGKIIRTTKQRKALIPKEFTVNISKPRVNLIYEELQTLDVDKYRNAVAVLFRVFLELSVKYFIRSKNLQIQSALHQKIKIVGDYIEKNAILTREELKPVYTATTKENKHSILSTETLNSYIHNSEHIPTSIDLKVLWDSMQKFIKKLWE